ncbi:MAG: hypothetical protein ACLP3K_09005 [Candidatus Acidiferrales bacterium]
MAKKPNDRETEIDQVRNADQSLASKAKQEAFEKRKILRIFSTKALQAMKAKDERAYAEQLRLANVPEGSPEWKLAWEYYRAHCG